MAIADAWMTWAARPDELPLPVGLVRKAAPKEDIGRMENGRMESGRMENDCMDLVRVRPDTLVSVGTEESCADRCTGGGSDKRASHPISPMSNPTLGRVGPRRMRTRPPARMLSLLAAVGIATVTMLVAPGCQTVLPIAVHAAISACIELVKSLVDEPADQLPQGYIPCDSFEWEVEGRELKFCVFCNPSVRSEVFIQFGCTGKYYPMRLRRIERPESPDTVDGISIEKIRCDERLLLDVRSTVAPFMAGIQCTMRVPNDRVLPSLENYGTLDARIDDAPAPRDGDFLVDAGVVVELDGSFDEVAHYAMTCGILELAFKDGGSMWTVHANPDVSAIAVFRDGELYDARFLFAPVPAEGLGH